MSLSYRGVECKSRKSSDTWSNRQIWPWSTIWSRSKANRVLRRECTVHSKHPLPTTQEKILHMDITRWPIVKSDWLYSLKLKSRRSYKGEVLYSQQKQDWEMNVAHIMNSLMLDSDLNEKSMENHQSIQVRPKSNPLGLYSGSENRFKGLYLIDRVPEELWMEVCDIV